jgi:hypothetical protein
LVLQQKTLKLKSLVNIIAVLKGEKDVVSHIVQILQTQDSKLKKEYILKVE